MDTVTDEVRKEMLRKIGSLSGPPSKDDGYGDRYRQAIEIVWQEHPMGLDLDEWRSVIFTQPGGGRPKSGAQKGGNGDKLIFVDVMRKLADAGFLPGLEVMRILSAALGFARSNADSAFAAIQKDYEIDPAAINGYIVKKRIDPIAERVKHDPVATALVAAGMAPEKALALSKAISDSI